MFIHEMSDQGKGSTKGSADFVPYSRVLLKSARAAGTAALQDPVQAEVAQISNLLCRRLPVGRCWNFEAACGLEIRDTADWKSGATGFLLP